MTCIVLSLMHTRIFRHSQASPWHHPEVRPVAWFDACDKAFNTLKNKLVQAPVLAYPQFELTAPVVMLQTDASSVGVSAILEQGGGVIAYKSRALNPAEQQYSVILRGYGKNL